MTQMSMIQNKGCPKFMKQLQIAFIIVASNTLVFSQVLIPGEIYFSPENHIEYQFGNLPLILSAPHGGDKLPFNIPDRDCPVCVTRNDAFTQELMRSVISKIQELTSCYPHVIINRLHRSKLDANRAVNEATDGNVIATIAYEAYHDWIDSSRTNVMVQHGKGLFIDLHGHGHEIQRLELGYLLTRSDLQKSNSEMTNEEIFKKSSVHHLSLNNVQNLSFTELLRGDQSLGTIFENRDYPAVPSALDPFPFGNESYFSGGYNTREYGSRDGGSIDAIQIECNQDVRFEENEREEFAEDLAIALVEFMRLHYFDDIDQGFCASTSIKKVETIDVSVHPNPVLNYLTIHGWSDQFYDLKIVNLLGQDIKEIQDFSGAESLQVQMLETGYYILKVLKGNQILGVTRFVKN